MDDLGSKHPMELLTEMVELVTPGEENTKLFAVLFMRWEDNHTDLGAPAEKADRCSVMLARKSGMSSV